MQNRVWILALISFLFSAWICSSEDTPNWKKRYRKVREEAIQEFVGKKMGDEITIVTTIGGEKTGTISAIGENGVVLSISGEN